MTDILIAEDLLKHFRGSFDYRYTSVGTSVNSDVYYTVEFTDSEGSFICFKKLPNQDLVSYNVDNVLRFDSDIKLELIEEFTIRVTGKLNGEVMPARKIGKINLPMWENILAFLPENSIKYGRVIVTKADFLSKLETEWNNKDRQSDGKLMDRYKISNNNNIIKLVYDMQGRSFLEYINSDIFEKKLVEEGLPSKAKFEKMVDMFDERLYSELNDCVSFSIYPYMWITGNSSGEYVKKEAKKILDKFNINM